MRFLNWKALSGVGDAPRPEKAHASAPTAAKVKPSPAAASGDAPAAAADPCVLGPAELEVLNAGTLAYIRSLSADEIRARVDAVSIDQIEDEVGSENALEMLEREGIVIVRDFLDPDRLDGATEAFERVSGALVAATPNQNFEDDEILVQSAEQVAKTYSALASHPKAVATIRHGADEGMVDVFNFDRLAGDRREALRDPFTRDWLLRLIGESDTPLEAKNLNLYFNRGITSTRGFHADSFRKSLKGFVYLSDVTSLDHGPYCFVRRTHVDGPWRQANQKISELARAKTESPFVDVSMIVPVLAPRGSLILSDQAGIHRGFPQAPDAERRVLVMRYL